MAEPEPAEEDKGPQLDRYRNDPVAFAREVLGVDPWTRQEEILRAVAGNRYVAVRSGHKVSKSCSAAILALWWVSTRPTGKVVMTSSTDRQVKLILWPELRRLHQGAQRAIGGEMHQAPSTGLVFPDGRLIVGFATKTPENMAGVSGAEILYIVDEASGVDDAIFEPIDGNLAGGGHLVLFGNPTRTSGKFYNVFHREREFWVLLHVSSEEAAEYQEKVRRIPGLATRDFIEERRRKWGPDYEHSPLYQVRVRGDFPSQAANTVIALALIEAGRERWPDTPEDGPLELGVDVAYYGDDDSSIAPRRGQRVLPLTAVHGMDPVDVAGKVLEVVRELRKDGEVPTVKIDVIGIGAGVYAILARSAEVVAIPVNVAEAPTVDPNPGEPGYQRLRDQLWFTTREWLKEGGALPDDGKLEDELLGPTYTFSPTGKLIVEPKAAMKKRIGRSPDRADSLALAIYNPPGAPTFTLPESIGPQRRDVGLATHGAPPGFHDDD